MKTGLAIWKLAILARRPARYLGLVWLLAAIAMAALYGSGREFRSSEVREIVAHLLGELVVATGAVLWLVYIASLNEQLSPDAVQLVPRMRRSALMTTLTFWLVMSAALTAELCVLGAHVASMGSLIAAVLALAVSRASLVGLPIFVAFCLPIVAVWAPGLLVFAPSTPLWVRTAVLLAALCAGGGFIVHEVGGQAERRRAPYDRSQAALRARRHPRGVLPWMVTRRPELFAKVFDSVLRVKSPRARALHGLSPGFHWSEAVLVTSYFCLIGALSAAAPPLITLFISSRSVSINVFNVGCSFALMTFASTVVLGARLLRELAKRQKEQALLLMLPGVPNAARANPWLMRALLVQHATAFAAAVVLTSGVTLVMMFTLDLGWRFCLRMMAVGPATALLATPFLLRNYAKMRESARSWFFVLVPVTLVLMALLYMRVTTGATALVVTTLVGPVAAGIRYFLFRDIPGALPVGRLAD